MIFIPKDKKCILKKTFIISMSGNEKIKTASFWKRFKVNGCLYCLCQFRIQNDFCIE